jgi:hypothetical protein
VVSAVLTRSHIKAIFFTLSYKLILNVYFQNDEAPVPRICYAAMKHVEGDVVNRRNCILLASGNRKKDLPFIAKVTSLWENPDDGMPTFFSHQIKHNSKNIEKNYKTVWKSLKGFVLYCKIVFTENRGQKSQKGFY